MDGNDNAMENYSLEPIGVIRSCYTEKFGIPRQAGLAEGARASIILKPPFDREEMVKALDQFSHIWVHFIFHQTLAEGWRSTIRPPGLGGQKRVGIFASRSPHRPNHLGFSAVSLLEIHVGHGETVLEIGGGDFLDGTPVVDIKPYIPYCDAIETAEGGYSGDGGIIQMVDFSGESDRFCRLYRAKTGRDLRTLITQVLQQDPRPASQRRVKREFGIRLWDVNIRWRVDDDSSFTVKECKLLRDMGE